MLGVRCRNLLVCFSGASGQIRAIEHLSFECAPGEFLAVVGPSGCGKTTLLRAVAGIIQPTEGTLERVGDAGGRGRALMVYQENSLFPWMTVMENAVFGLRAQGMEKPERERRAREWLRRFGLLDRASSFPGGLSVGMKQRVAVIRSFLSEPTLLLMDEPFGALDAQTRLALQQELLSVWEERRITVIFVTHDVEEALLLSDRVLVMSRQPGRVLDEVRVDLERPRTAGVCLSEEFLRLKRRVYRTLGIAVHEVARA